MCYSLHFFLSCCSDLYIEWLTSGRGERRQRGERAQTGWQAFFPAEYQLYELLLSLPWQHERTHPTRCFSSLGQVRAMPDSSSRNGVAGPALLYLSWHLGLCSEVRRVLISATETEQGLFWQLSTPQEEAGRSSQDLRYCSKAGRTMWVKEETIIPIPLRYVIVENS